jgi:hypothetical protein
MSCHKWYHIRLIHSCWLFLLVGCGGNSGITINFSELLSIQGIGQRLPTEVQLDIVRLSPEDPNVSKFLNEISWGAGQSVPFDQTVRACNALRKQRVHAAVIKVRRGRSIGLEAGSYIIFVLEKGYILTKTVEVREGYRTVDFTEKDYYLLE